MADVFSRAKRSAVMSRIRSHGNKDTELALIQLFRTAKITGWRRNQPLPGKPDFVFIKNRLAIFVDGCFWHGCNAHSKPPKTNCDYWREKLARNKRRDRAVSSELKRGGWKVLRFWEHDLSRRKRSRAIARLRKALER